VPFGSVAISKPSEGSIAKPNARFLANLCPNPLGFDVGSAHYRLLFEYSPG
jgi:hypothetical protein